MIIKVNQFVGEIEVDDFIDIEVENGAMNQTIKKLTLRLSDQLSFVLEEHDEIARDFLKTKELVKQENLKRRKVIDLSLFV